MPQDTPSPIDLPEPELDEAGLGWSFGVILIASLFLFCANAASLRDWIDDQPPSPAQQQAAEYADRWVETTERFGVGLPRKAMHDQLLPVLIKDYVMPGKVYLVYHEFPLAMHSHSREAAHYATAAARFGIYQPVADRLFLNQSSWAASGKVWDTVAVVLSPDQQKKVQALAKDPSVMAAVQQDVELGQRERVTSTPTLILTHGKQKFPLPSPVNYNFLRSLLDGYLR